MSSHSARCLMPSLGGFAYEHAHRIHGFQESMGFDEHVLQTFGRSPYPSLHQRACVAFFFLAQQYRRHLEKKNAEVRGLNDFHLSRGNMQLCFESEV